MNSHSLTTCIFTLFFFNVPVTTHIYTLSLHDALPISFTASGGASCRSSPRASTSATFAALSSARFTRPTSCGRSEEHTSELQSRLHLVCRLLLEKKKNIRRPSCSSPRTSWPCRVVHPL